MITIHDSAAEEIAALEFDREFAPVLSKMLGTAKAFGGGDIYRDGAEGSKSFLINARITVGVIYHGNGYWGFHS